MKLNFSIPIIIFYKCIQSFFANNSSSVSTFSSSSTQQSTGKIDPGLKLYSSGRAGWLEGTCKCTSDATVADLIAAAKCYPETIGEQYKLSTKLTDLDKKLTYNLGAGCVRRIYEYTGDSSKVEIAWGPLNKHR